ncbi:uncharacterized protein STEHIDRAFT_143145 [Stereum hirsutum FP-91666 SS1]|uniref:Uncharacterized protein n=1 Tax=Stereum hirsutum (strain FP-91666) TaxID=721885 RepID=R7RY52_STEHR|nr:uncharacterized protein STEHIDRAFT_143145 [Stereum hirsutum FP-91666 SS1]EIM79733.1 hypothetical protein STEHIDRAFT_143145 [Stereum hirsutum FP-91666 SS1]
MPPSGATLHPRGHFALRVVTQAPWRSLAVPPKGHDPTSLVTSSQVPAQSSSQQPRLQWPDQEQPSMIDTDSHHISSSNPVWDQRYLSNWNTPSTTGGTGSSESPSRSLSHSSESYSPAPHAFVPPYPSPLGRGRTRDQDHISQPHPDEPPYVKRRRVTVGSSSSTSTAPSSNRRFYNFNDRTRSTAVGSSGSMMITFPVESGSSGPNQSHVASDLRGPLVVQPPSQILHPAGLLPDDFEHGPTELPPRPYSRPTAPSSPPGGSCATPVGSKDGDSGKEKTRRRKPHLPDDVMDYLPTLEGRLSKIELGVRDYIDYRQQRAIEKSLLPPAPRAHSDPGADTYSFLSSSTTSYASSPSHAHAPSSHAHDPDKQNEY